MGVVTLEEPAAEDAPARTTRPKPPKVPPREQGFAFGFKSSPAPDHNAAWETWRKSGREPADNLAFLESINPILDKAINIYVGGRDPAARGKAKMLALKAAANWDAKRSNLQTHLLTQLQPLRRYAAGRRYATKVPERSQWQLQRMKEAEEELRDQLDRDPTDVEIADYTGLSQRRLGRLRRYGAQIASGSFLEAEIQPNTEGDEPDMWEEMVYHDLGAVDRAIYEGRTGRNGRKVKSVEQLARELGVGVGTVSKRAARIADLLVKRPEGW
jgi:hypothetical protein